jgi:hypothetical protein
MGARLRLSIVVRLALLLAVVSTTSVARAALLPTHDLASLAFLAEHVVRATRMAERPGPDGSTITTVRIDHVYAGTLSTEAPIDLDLGLYGTSLDPFDPTSKKPAPNAPVVLFLRRAAAPPRGGPAATGPAFVVVSSGMRVWIDGGTYRFEQWSNPGGFAPRPQGPEPCDLQASERCDEPVSRERFEADLRAALDRAKQARAVLDDAKAPAATLLAWVGPPEGEAESRIAQLGGYVVDAIASRASELVWERGTIDEVLEATARTIDRGLDQGPPVTRFGRRDFEAVATSPTAWTRRRVAALAVLAERWFPKEEPSERSFDVLVPLLDDPDPLVRRASIAALSRDRGVGRFALWIRRRWAKESDARVLLALLRAGDAVGALPFPEAPPGELPVVHAELSGRSLVIAWASGHTPPPRLATLALAWTGPSGTTRRELAAHEVADLVRTGTTESSAVVPLAFEGLAPSTEYGVVVEAVFTDDGDPARRRIDLGRVLTPARTDVARTDVARPIASSAVPLPSASVAASGPAASSGEAPGGCSCTVPIAPSSSCGGWLVLAVVVARARARVRRHARACSDPS